MAVIQLSLPGFDAVPLPTDGLFFALFPDPRSAARIDRIAAARAADLRQNRFAAWGVK